MKNLILLILISIGGCLLLTFRPLSSSPVQEVELSPEFRMEPDQQKPSSMIPEFLKASENEFIKTHHSERPSVESSTTLSIFSIVAIGSVISKGTMLFSASSSAAFACFFTGVIWAFLLGVFGFVDGMKGLKTGRGNRLRWQKSRVGTILASIVLTGITTLLFIVSVGIN